LLKREHTFCFRESIQCLQGLEIHDGQALVRAAELAALSAVASHDDVKK